MEIRAEKITKPVTRVSKSIYFALILVFMFGLSAVSKASTKLKRVFKNTKDRLRSSQTQHVLKNSWSFFLPTWQSAEEGSEDTQDLVSELPSNLAEVENVLSDPESRVEDDFKVSDGMKERVKFWLTVYSRYSSEYRIIHDREDVSIVYGVIDMRPIYWAFKDRKVARLRAHQIEQRIIKEMKAKFNEALDLSHTNNMDPKEKETIKAYLSKYAGDDKAKAALLIKNVRSQSGQSDMFLAAIRRSAQYIPEIEEIMKEKNLPIALARLPFVESSFNRYALSKVGAMGMWQFTPETAKVYYPRGTKAEWADPMKQARAAAKMFSSFRKTLPDWGSAITAYNSGPMRLAKMVEKYNVNEIEELVQIPSKRDTLGFAGKNFYAEFLAAIHAEAYKDKLYPMVAIQGPNQTKRKIVNVADLQTDSAKTRPQ